MDKLTQLTKEYNELAGIKEYHKECLNNFNIDKEESGNDKKYHKRQIKLCDREMDKLKKEISEISKNDN